MNPTGALSELDEYRFEAGGWVVLPAILTAEQLAGLNALLDEVCVRVCTLPIPARLVN